MAIHNAHMHETDLIDKLLEVLREFPDVDAHSSIRGLKRDQGIDVEVEVDFAGKSYVLLVDLKKSVYPRDAQHILWKWRHFLAVEGAKYRKNKPVPLLAAESISPGVKQLLKDEKFGYFDSGGSLFIPAPGAYIYVDKPPPRPLKRLVRGLFKGKRAQVLHTLLLRHNEWFGVKKLAELAMVSPATASETLTALERFEWISAKGKGPSKERCLAEPGALLDKWQKQIIADPHRLAYRRYYVPASRPDELAQYLAHLCEMHHVEYVLTQEIAAQMYAPFLTSVSRVTCRMVPGRAAENVIGELGARAVSEGANLNVMETKSQGEFMFKENLDSMWLASAVQVYLDLLQSGGRAKDMAEHLRRERIGF